ncbi:nitroreductase [Streptococcus macacae]|uniref:Nitroreductase family protein n=1 Tax=Streptococcus macacae NCTC 11558 TaxID=764298 RepID=G5JVF9_9STRE|nr:nitroreductase [Streptococcus macacae]EHJ53290.1 nitroreductase family protein [Streptococcus macacae NCTC 11558]SUN78555.1 nitroreductase family protein [Streptococcus macacae NCTC 11558]
MEFQQVLKKRHSVRDFSEKPIAKDLLIEIIKEAQTAPSWVNSQPWKVYIATGESLRAIKTAYKENIAADKPRHPDFSPLPREQWAAFPQKNMAATSASIGQAFGENITTFNEAQVNLFNAQAIAYLTIPKDSPNWSIHDLGAFSQTLMLSAADKGIGSINAFALVLFPDDVRKILDIPHDQIIPIAIALGYSRDTLLGNYTSKRLPVEDILIIKD